MKAINRSAQPQICSATGKNQKNKKKSAPRQFEMAKITVRWWLSWWWTYNLLIKIFYVAAGQAKKNKREEGMRLFCASSFTEPVVQFRNFRSNRIFGPVNMTAVQKKNQRVTFRTWADVIEVDTSLFCECMSQVSGIFRHFNIGHIGRYLIHGVQYSLTAFFWLLIEAKP